MSDVTKIKMRNGASTSDASKKQLIIISRNPKHQAVLFVAAVIVKAANYEDSD